MYIEGVNFVTPTKVKNPYGSYDLDWSNPTLTPLGCRCSIQPETTTDIYNGSDRTTVHTGWKLITEPPATVTPPTNARVRVPGLGFDLSIVGDPQTFLPVRPHTELNLEVYRG